MKKLILLSSLFVFALMLSCFADEGMWLYEVPPNQLLKDRYGFELTKEWLEHLQKSSVRFNNGGSGSFVSGSGLVITNHHVGADALQKFSDKEHNYLRDGLCAHTLNDEKRCHDLELNVMISIEDVTDSVNAAVKSDMNAEQAFLARRAAIAEIEKESFDKTGLRSDVVTLYHGGLYHLYRFKKYTDVRLVFAPQQQIAFFGGDPDNFEYPRFCLDFCLFRVYEQGKPAVIENYLKWSKSGPSKNELVFVSGHPGRTNRLSTLAELKYLRDTSLPYYLKWLKSMEVLLNTYSRSDKENATRLNKELFIIKNGRKRFNGMFAGLLEPELFAQKKAYENKLRKAVSGKTNLKETADAWDIIAEAQKIISENELRYNLLERANGFNSELFRIARTLLRAADELPKPNSERLREFGQAGLESLKFQLFSEKPIYDDIEKLKLADSLSWLVMYLGYSDTFVQKVLAGKSPQKRAEELVEGTKLKSVALRKQLYEGGRDAINSAKDPMIELAELIDAESRKVRMIIDKQKEIKRQAHASLARARFVLERTNNYPDATFTLRLAFGKVKGYKENGKHISFQTDFAGLFKRAAEQDYKPPFNLPQQWLKQKDNIDLSTPLNFVSTADITGGNSGSPVVNRKGEYIGLIFDGNTYSLLLDFHYTEDKARAVSVHSKAITEALYKVYDAKELADELLGKKAIE